MKKVKHFIDGEMTASVSKETFPNVNPATGKEFATIARGDAADIDAAVDAARRAFQGPWSDLSKAERLDCLVRVAHGIRARSEEFLKAEMKDTGKPRSFAAKVDIPRGAANFEFFARLARNTEHTSFHTETGDGRGALQYVTRHPLGVIGVICPWNLPLLLLTWKVAPALAAGNCVVVKPSEETPTTATLLGEVFKDAGVPDGVYNVVHGFGPGEAGEALTKHPDVAAITFTGETHTGSRIMEACAPHIKKVSFELGGKNPAIVFADTDFDAAIDGTIRSVFSNTGQVCLCSERVYVEHPLFDRFVETLASRAQDLKVGDPFDDDTDMGPLISQAHREKVLAAFASATDAGAEVVTGGGVPDLSGKFKGGSFVEPTIWTGLPEDAAVIKDEIFGPVCHIQPFDEEEEVLAMANDTRYGLCAALWTRDLQRAHRVAAGIEAGLVWVNSWFLRDLRAPFGGVKMSGIGREGGVHSLNFYSESKTVCVKL